VCDFAQSTASHSLTVGISDATDDFGQQKEILMLMTKPTLAVIAAVVAGNIVSPAFAQVVRHQEDRAPIHISASARAACMPDAMRLCRDAVPNVRNVLICFGQNRDKISNRCLTVLASYGLQ
jgi:hypothetical protein